MRIYFAGSIRGSKANRETYRIIVDQLKSYGAVLTEHVAEKYKSDEPEFEDVEIFERDLRWLKSADVLVAEVTAPSLGVGYEIGKAEELGLPVLCLFHQLSGGRLSAMINGNGNLLVKRYGTIPEVKEIIDNYLSKLVIANSG